MKQKQRKKHVHASLKATGSRAPRPHAPAAPLLGSMSMLAVSLLPGVAAAAVCDTASGGTKLINAAESCVVWTQGNLRVMNTGTIAGSSVGIEANVSGFQGELDNFGTIVGTEAAIRNLANLREISNSGIIASTANGVTTAGIMNEATGSITSIVNTAGHTITGGRAGVFNRGKITLVSNLGVISSNSPTAGTVAGIWNNAGTIGNLVNSGTLQGATVAGQPAGFGIVAEYGSVLTNVNNSGTSTGLVGLLAQNNASVGTLTNTGTISGTSAGVSLSRSTLGTLTNDGIIAGISNVPPGGVASARGIYASRDSVIGPVLNRGTIMGRDTALQLDGTSSIGVITNSGLIAGDITSASPSNLVITGGSGNAIGTLTGASGGVGAADKGFIKVTAANLVFSGGNLLLNDDIGAVGRTVVNDGATLHIANPINVLGNYTQTGGALVFQAASSTAYGYLGIDGEAAISNAAITLDGTGLADGQTYKVVRATGATSYAGNTVFLSTNNGLLARLSEVDGELVITVAHDAKHHYWTGANTTATGTITGGSGTWTANGTNWTSSDGRSNGRLDTADVRPVFAGAAGTVNVDTSQGAIDVNGMQFSTDGYRLTGGAIGLAAATAALEVDENATAIIDTTLAGSGQLAKTGKGTLILNGVNTYTGGTTVEAGMLAVGDANHPGARILGNVSVGTAATLRGHGTITGNVTNDGVVRPGGSIGTLTISGNYTQSATGALFIDVSPTSASQLKVGGTAALAGTLNVLYGPGTYSATSYRIIDAERVTGRFVNVTSNAPASLAQSVQNLADGSTLTLAANPPDNGGGDSGGGDTGGGNNGGGTVVIAPSNATVFSAVASAATRETQRVNAALLSRLGRSCADAAAAADCARPGQAWAQIVSNTAHVRGNSSAPSYKDSHYGFLAGLDQRAGAWTLGMAGGYSHVDVSEDNASGKIDSLRVAGYASRRAGAFDLAATVGAAYDFIQSRRSFAGLGRARGDGDGQEIFAGLQASLPLAAGPFTITPSAGLRYQYLHVESFRETGGTSQNLNLDSQDFNSLQPYAQLAVGIPFSTSASRPGLVEARAGYAYETMDAHRRFRATSGDGTGFTLPSVGTTRGMVTAGLGVTLPVGKALDVSASYDRLFSTGNVSAQAFQLQATYRF